MSTSNWVGTSDFERTRAETNFQITMAGLPAYLAATLSPYGKNGKPRKMKPIALWAKPGVGKSHAVRDYARDVIGGRLVDIRLGQYDPTDLKGIPVREPDGSVRWVTSSYLPQAIIKTIPVDAEPVSVEFNFLFAEVVAVDILDEKNTIITDQFSVEVKDPKHQVMITAKSGGYRKVKVVVREKAVVFLDEISTAPVSVQNAALSLVLDRTVGEYKLPDFVPVLAAGNTEDDGAFVQPISSALANRFCHLRLVPDLPAFISYGFTVGMNPTVLGFLQTYGSTFLHKYNAEVMKDGQYGFPSPRVWENVAEMLDEEHSDAISKNLAVGYLGHEVGIQFSAYMDIRGKMPDIKGILDGRVEFNPSSMGDSNKGDLYMLINALTLRLVDYFKEAKPALEANRNNQDKWPLQWVTAVNAAFKLCEKLDRDMRISMFFLIKYSAKIDAHWLRTEGFRRWSSQNVDIISQLSSWQS